MKKEFNDTGNCVHEYHYLVDTTKKINQVLELVERRKYFTINRPRQYGKTTTIHLLSQMLEKKPEYLVISTSFEGIGDSIFENEEHISKGVLDILADDAEFNEQDFAQLLRNEISNVSELKSLSKAITKIVQSTDRKIVIVIDEVDKSSNNQLFLSFLGMLRDKYINQSKGKDKTFHSVILAGVHDIKTLKLKLRPDSKAKLNSPWNIAVDFNVDLSFDAKEIETMLHDYTNETGIEMDIPAIAQRLYFYTSGYPFLVSKMCKFIDERILPETNANQWTLSDVEKSYLLITDEGYTTTLFDDLFKNIEHNKELYQFVFDIVINGYRYKFNINDTITNLANVYGIIRNDSGFAAIHNRIFEQRIYNYLLAKTIRENKTTDSLSVQYNYVENDKLNMNLILQRFQQFMKENYSDKDARFIEREGRLLFMSFLKPIINSRGHDFKEPVVGEERRTDLVITFENNKYVVELKVWRGDAYHQKGLKQLSDYLDIYSLKKGYLLIFDFNKNKTYKEENIVVDDKEIFAVWV